jgi:hypothetical protein
MNCVKNERKLKTTSEMGIQTFQKKFNVEKFRCILKVLYGRLFDKDVEKMNRFEDQKENSITSDKGTKTESGEYVTYSDPYLLKLRSFLLNENQFGDLDPLKDIGDVSFIRMFNQLFVDFNNFKEVYKKKFLECELEDVMKNTEERCKQKYGDYCMKNDNQVSYGVKCKDNDYISYKGYFCFIKCPKPYIEQKNKCMKPPHITVKFIMCILIDS